MGPPTKKAGVLIIGGGIIGLSIAYYLSLRKYRDAVVIERDKQVAMHASGHNASGIVPPRESKARETWDLYSERLELFKKLSETKGFDFDFKMNGLLEIRERGISREENLRVLQELRDSKVNVKMFEDTQLQEIEPNLSTKGIASAFYYPEGAQGNSGKLAASFARACKMAGFDIRTNTAVQGFNMVDGKVESVETNRGDFRADTVVLAAGPWSGEVAAKAGLKLPIEPAKGHLISVKAKQKDMVKTFVMGPTDYYVTQVSPKEIVVGGGVDMVGFNESADEKRVTEAWNEGVSFFPFLRSMKRGATVTCFRPYAPGGLPVLGKSSRFSNLVFATGHHMNGITLAPVTGLIMSQVILDGESKRDIAAFSPARFSC